MHKSVEASIVFFQTRIRMSSVLWRTEHFVLCGKHGVGWPFLRTDDLY